MTCTDLYHDYADLLFVFCREEIILEHIQVAMKGGLPPPQSELDILLTMSTSTDCYHPEQDR